MGLKKAEVTDNTKCWQGCGAPRTLIHCQWGMQNGTATLENSFGNQCLTKINIHFSYDSTIPHLSIYPRRMKAYVYTKTCIQTFVAELFIITKN